MGLAEILALLPTHWERGNEITAVTKEFPVIGAGDRGWCWCWCWFHRQTQMKQRNWLVHKAQLSTFLPFGNKCTFYFDKITAELQLLSMRNGHTKYMQTDLLPLVVASFASSSAFSFCSCFFSCCSLLMMEVRSVMFASCVCFCSSEAASPPDWGLFVSVKHSERWTSEHGTLLMSINCVSESSQIRWLVCTKESFWCCKIAIGKKQKFHQSRVITQHLLETHKVTRTTFGQYIFLGRYAWSPKYEITPNKMLICPESGCKILELNQ